MIDVTLQGKICVEASAGTGKTWMVAHLVLCLLVREGRDVKDILVTTFTNMATHEMKARIQNRLLNAHMAWRAYQTGANVQRDGATCRIAAYELPADDWDMLMHTAESMEEDEVVTHRLENACENFDLVSIYTNHSFCQQVISEYAYELGLTPAATLGEIPQSLDEQLALDYAASGASLPAGWDIAKLKGLVAQALRSPRATLPTFAEEITPQAIDDLKKKWLQKHAMYVDNNSYAVFDSRSQTAIMKRLDILVSQNLSASKAFQDVLAETAKWSQAYAAQFQEDISLLQQISKWQQQYQESLMVRAYQWAVGAREDALARIQLMPFDDVLWTFLDALRKEKEHAEQPLSSALRQRFKAVVVDEFQDTDPVQAEIFETLFLTGWQASDKHVFVLVGDPKQSIYRFRGADLDSYERLADAPDGVMSLSVNRRSDEGVVAAVNHLYQANADALQHVKFNPVDSSHPSRLLTHPLDSACTIWSYQTVGTKTATKTRICIDVARDIQARIGKQWIQEEGKWRKVKASDIAVLGHANADLEAMRQALKKLEVNAARKARLSVYGMPHAIDWWRMLRAMASGDKSDVQCACTHGLLGSRLALKASEKDVLSAMVQCKQWSEKLSADGPLQWLEQNWLPVLQQKAEQNKFDMEVFFTHCRHLGEGLQEAWLQNIKQPKSLAVWLERRIAKAINQTTAPEEDAIRIEAESDAVQLSTIHASKGLEYGVVYLPWVWAGRDADAWYKKDMLVVADGADTQLVCNKEKLVVKEETAALQAEQQRLLYVALTRARHQVVIVRSTGSTNTALKTLFEDISHAHIKEQVITTEHRVIPAYKLPSLPADAQEAGRGAETEVTQALPRLLNWQMPVRMSSFSGLPKETYVYHPPKMMPTGLLSTVAASGAAIGTLVHEAIEAVLLLPIASRKHAMTEVVAEKTTLYLPELEDTQRDIIVGDLLEVLSRPLPLGADSGLSLLQLHSAQFFPELGFMMSLKENAFESRAFADGLRLGDGRPQWQAWCDKLSRKAWGGEIGYLQGEIDLVLQHEGRWYIVDWKTNIGVASGGQDEVWTEMAAHHYPLQAAVYTLALHRLLQARLPDYQSETHLGGVYYAFLRGMKPAADAWQQDSDGQTQGLWFYRFNEQQLDALSRLCVSTNLEVAT